MTVTKTAAKPARVFYNFIQRKLGMQQSTRTGYSRAKYLSGVALQNVTASVESDATIDGEYMGYGGFLHGTIIPRATAKMPLIGATPIVWDGHSFVTPGGEKVMTMKRAVVIDHTIIGWGVNA